MIRSSVGICLIIFLSGCAVVSGTDSSASGNTEAEPGGTSSPGDITENPVARDREAVQPESDAVRYLLDNAERSLEIEDYSRAQALADRALRIERTTARAYLISALVQLGYGDILKAQDLARQGLLYTSSETNIGRKLLAVVPDKAL